MPHHPAIALRAPRRHRRRWGSFRGGEVRPGITHVHLVVFPPGTTDREGTLLRGWRCWPFVGTLGAGLLVAVLATVVPTLTAALAALALYVAGGLILRRSVRRHRAHVCVLDAEHVADTRDDAELVRCGQLGLLAATLAGAEASYGRGELSAVDFERIWGVAWDEARALA